MSNDQNASRCDFYDYACFCSVSVFSGIIVRNLVVGLAVPALFYAFSLLMTFSYEIFSTLNPILQKKDLFNKLPLLSLQ